MARRVALAIVASVMLVVGLWVRPALASTAPFCDERAATALAPPPAPRSPQDTLARGTACHPDPFAGLATLFAGLFPGHPAPDASPATFDAAVPVALPPIAPAAGADVCDTTATDAPTPGVRFRVERPPRF